MKTNITRYLLVATFVTFSCFSFITTALAQTTPCGNIVGPESFFNIGGNYDNIVTEPIVDCNDPFNITIDPPSPYTLDIDGVEIQNGETYIKNEPIQRIDVLGRIPDTYVERFLFKHEEDDYVFIDESVPEPTQDEYRAFAATYFETEAEAEQYLTILFAEQETGDIDQYIFDEEYEYLIDANTGESIYDRYYNFQSAANNYLYGRVPAYASGTYTMVMRESLLMVVYNSLWQDIREFFIKTAHAQYNIEPNYYTITFTIADPTPEPVGASSVLFLPGIQASRLYSDGMPGTENQLWEPNANTDVNDLRMNVSGGSINDIYTRDVVDEVAIPIFGGNIYKGFLGMLEDLVDSETINDYEAFAYDWRYAVDDIVTYGTRYEHEIRNVVTAVERLAEDSYSGKVTVIGHSNGGLVTKMLIKELERQGKANLVDKVVFIATPHLGTPKAIATVLHGYDQQKLGGAVIDDSLARAIIQNMPGVYGLLPSQRYLELASESIITISEGVSTQPMYEAFDGEIEGVTEYRNFLNGVEGRTDDFADISNPYRTNPYMLQGALDLHAELDYWEAPEGIEVFNLVGVGLPTVSKVEYRNVTEIKNCVSTLFGQIICDTVHFLRPYAHFTQYGDETVTSLSSELVEGETFYFNFEDYRAENILFSGQVHANITEVEGVRDYIEEIIVDGHPSLTTYIFENSPNFSREYEVTSIDSPVRIIKEDSLGNKTGVVIQDGVAEIVKEIPGSEYVEFGGTKYVIVPKDEDMTTYLYGEDHGSYTLTTATLSGDEQVTDTQIINATTTPTMVAQYEFVDGAYSTILTDYDGDGTTDLEMTVSGEVISEPEITFDSLRTQILDLGLSKPRVKPLLILVNLAEKAQKLKVHSKISKRISDRLLMQLRDTIKLYAKKGWITQERSEILKSTIDKLISK